MEYFPRQQLRDRLMSGWKLIPGVDYPRNEWAFLMQLPTPAIMPSQNTVDKTMLRFARPERVLASNLSAAGSSRNHGRSNSERWAEFYRAKLARPASALGGLA